MEHIPAVHSYHQVLYFLISFSSLSFSLTCSFILHILPSSSSPLSSTAFVRASLCLTVCVLREENRNKKDDEILYESNMWRGYVYKVKWVVHQNTVHVASYML